MRAAAAGRSHPAASRRSAAAALLHVYVACAAAAPSALALLGPLLFGVHLSLANGASEDIAFDVGVGSAHWHVRAIEGLITSLYVVGAAVGCMTGDRLAAWTGPRGALLACAQVLMLTPALTAASTAFPFWNGISHRTDGRPLRLLCLLAARAVTGVAAGVALAVAPSYVRQVGPRTPSTAAATSTHLAAAAGSLLSVALALLGTVLQPRWSLAPGAWWRAECHVAALLAVAMGLGLLTCPESPQWLRSQRRSSEAEAASMRLFGHPHSTHLGGHHGSGGRGADAAASPTTVRLPSGYGAAAGGGAPCPAGEAEECGGGGPGPGWLGTLLALQPLPGLCVFLHSSTPFLRAVGIPGQQQLSLLIVSAHLLGHATASAATASTSTAPPPPSHTHAARRRGWAAVGERLQWCGWGAVGERLGWYGCGGWGAAVGERLEWGAGGHRRATLLLLLSHAGQAAALLSAAAALSSTGDNDSGSLGTPLQPGEARASEWHGVVACALAANAFCYALGAGAGLALGGGGGGDGGGGSGGGGRQLGGGEQSPAVEHPGGASPVRTGGGHAIIIISSSSSGGWQRGGRGGAAGVWACAALAAQALLLCVDWAGGARACVLLVAVAIVHACAQRAL
ncbi:hypothetical protein FOA52_008076 [Chlamydomonas sp. UWO 241]|nr:hypothetical protein FOA52_008076 [Chlamydomonas sp. UWO 241]